MVFSVWPNKWAPLTRRIVYAMMLVSLHSLMKTRLRHRFSNYARLPNVEIEWPSNKLPESTSNCWPLSQCVCHPDPQSTQAKRNAARLAAGPSGIMAEMMKAASKEGVELARQLTEAVFSCDVIPTDWKESYILNLYMGARVTHLTMAAIVVSSSQAKSWSCWN